ncbi:MAG: UbiA prenyltransferase family protein [Candidatus Hermodarchaeota archaeon]
MSSKIRSIFNLLRIRQYYKNVLIFVSIFFSYKIFHHTLYFPLILGFVLLCCASSFNYIINDIKDVESDKQHPEKMRKKPLASGDLPVYFAVLLLVILVGIIVFSIIFLIPHLGFLIMLILVILTGQFYNHFLKNYAFIDILVLSTGYLWRALAGVVIIDDTISPWLFLAIFEIAMFLSIAKRRGDLLYLGKDKAIEHKKVYDKYSVKLLDQFYVLIAASLFMTYSLYLITKFFIIEGELIVPELPVFMVIFTIPISLYIIMRFMYLTSLKPEIARRTEKVFFDKGIIVSGLLLFLILFTAYYYNIIIALVTG